MTTVNLDELDAAAGEWLSVQSLLMSAATVAYTTAVSGDSNIDKRFAEACERVALLLGKARDPEAGFRGTNEQRHPWFTQGQGQPIGRTFPPPDEDVA